MVDEAESLIKEARIVDNSEEGSSEETESSSDAKESIVESLETDNSFDTDEVLAKIANEDIYNLSSKLVSISLYDRRFIKYLSKVVMMFPKELRIMAKEVIELKQDAKIIPEAFTHVRLATFLIEQDFMNNLNVTPSESDLVDLWKYLSSELRELVVFTAENTIRAKIAMIIQNSGVNTTEFLEKALEREQLEIAKLHERFGLNKSN